MPRGSKPGERRGGRKAGTPNKATREVKAVAGRYTVECVRTLMEIVRKKKAPPAARVAACKEVLDRAHGRPAQAVTGPDGGDLSLTIKRIVHEHHPGD